MKEHKWILEEIDGGHLGTADVLTCSECGAGAGGTILTLPPFYPNGSGLKLSQDCDESKRLIAAFKLGQSFGTRQTENGRTSLPPAGLLYVVRETIRNYLRRVWRLRL